MFYKISDYINLIISQNMNFGVVHEAILHYSSSCYNQSPFLKERNLSVLGAHTRSCKKRNFLQPTTEQITKEHFLIRRAL